MTRVSLSTRDCSVEQINFQTAFDGGEELGRRDSKENKFKEKEINCV